MAGGVVNMSEFQTGAGHIVQINHGGGWFSTYIHLQGPGAAEGTRVAAGQQIGKLGSILGKPIDLSAAPGVTTPTMGKVGAGPQLQTKLGPAGSITTSYGDPGGYAEQRGRVEEALMSRMNPQLERDRQTLRAQRSYSGR